MWNKLLEFLKEASKGRFFKVMKMKVLTKNRLKKKESPNRKYQKNKKLQKLKTVLNLLK